MRRARCVVEQEALVWWETNFDCWQTRTKRHVHSLLLSTHLDFIASSCGSFQAEWCSHSGVLIVIFGDMYDVICDDIIGRAKHEKQSSTLALACQTNLSKSNNLFYLMQSKTRIGEGRQDEEMQSSIQYRPYDSRCESKRRWCSHNTQWHEATCRTTGCFLRGIGRATRAISRGCGHRRWNDTHGFNEL